MLIVSSDLIFTVSETGLPHRWLQSLCGLEERLTPVNDAMDVDEGEGAKVLPGLSYDEKRGTLDEYKAFLHRVRSRFAVEQTLSEILAHLGP